VGTTLAQLFPGVAGFQWDEGNSEKNWRRHAVTQTEAEQVFFNRPIVVGEVRRPVQEARHFSLGQTDGGRELAVVFVIRGSSLRVISARPMSRRERKAYGDAKARADS
jgi:uncharacterized DUF497 family protein